MGKRRQILSKDELSTPLIANLAQHDESAQHILQPSNSDDVHEETSPPHAPADIEQPVDPLRFITVPTPRDAQYRANDLRLANILVDEPWDPAVDDHIARHVFTTTENYNDVDHIRLVAERLWHSSFLLAQRPALLQAEWDLVMSYSIMDLDLFQLGISQDQGEPSSHNYLLFSICVIQT